MKTKTTTAGARTQRPTINAETGEQVIVTKRAVVFVNIEYDSDCANPLTDCDGMGHIHSLNRRHINSVNSQEELDALLKDQDAVALSYFEHGNCLWDVQHGENISRCPDMQWDGVTFAGVWVPDDSCREHIEIAAKNEKGKRTRREIAVECATQACRVYTSWANGECYYFSAAAFKPILNNDGEVSEERAVYNELGEKLGADSCGGFVGDDIKYMVSEHVQPFVDQFLAK